MHGTYSATSTPRSRSSTITAPGRSPARARRRRRTRTGGGPRRRRQRLDPVDVLEQLGVARSSGGSERQHPVQLLELRDPERGLKIGPAVVEPEPHVVEPAGAVVGPALVAQAAEQLPLLLGVRRDDAALAGRHLLVRVEAEDARRAVGADRRPLVAGAECLGRVLDQRDPVPVAQLASAARARMGSRTCPRRRAPSSAR